MAVMDLLGFQPPPRPLSPKRDRVEVRPAAKALAAATAAAGRRGAGPSLAAYVNPHPTGSWGDTPLAAAAHTKPVRPHPRALDVAGFTERTNPYVDPRAGWG